MPGMNATMQHMQKEFEKHLDDIFDNPHFRDLMENDPHFRDFILRGGMPHMNSHANASEVFNEHWLMNLTKFMTLMNMTAPGGLPPPVPAWTTTTSRPGAHNESKYGPTDPVSKQIPADRVKRIVHLLTTIEKFSKTLSPSFQLGKKFLYADVRRITIQSLQQLCPIIQWKEYFAYHDIKVNMHQFIFVENVNYFAELATLYGSHPKNTREKLMLHRVARDLLAKANAYVHGRKANLDGFSFCFNETYKIFGPLLHSIYEKKFFTPDLSTKIRALADKVRQAMIEGMNKATWIDNMSKANITDKLRRVNVYLGNQRPTVSVVANPIDRKAFPQKESTFDKYYMHGNAYVYKMLMDYLKTPKMPGHYERTFANNGPYKEEDFLPFYDSRTNSLIVPVELLQPPVYYEHNSQPYLEFGKLGSIIGHALAYAMDTNQNSYPNNKWIYNSDTDHVMVKKQVCFKNYYNGLGDLQRSNFLLNETYAFRYILGDFEGVKNSYKAFAKEVGNDLTKQVLPPLTNAQAFFTAYAQFWCSGFLHRKKAEVDSYERFRASTRYLPTSLRVNGPLSIIAEVADAFECPHPSNLSSSHICHDWTADRLFTD